MSLFGEFGKDDGIFGENFSEESAKRLENYFYKEVGEKDFEERGGDESRSYGNGVKEAGGEDKETLIES